jgi:protein gp37
MMNKTKIEWCDFTYNPVTGCRHKCEYCYARRQAQRFCGDIRLNKTSDQLQNAGNGLWILEEPFKNNQGKVIPLPVGFEPTLHRYRLPMPAQKKKPANIFVCSMADLFGEWVPDEWIKEVLTACAAAPWHNYLFLTKNPERYKHLMDVLPEEYGTGKLEFWWGVSSTDRGWMNMASEIMEDAGSGAAKMFVSIEPLLDDVAPEINTDVFKWVIAGAQTGPGARQNKPKREWIQNIVDKCRRTNTPLFMKDSLLEIWEDPLIQQFPKALQLKEDIIPHCDGCEHHMTTPEGKRGERHVCKIGTAIHLRHIPGRYARTSPPWCPKRGGGDQ